MKKLIALLLALLMVSSAVIAVSAEETGEAVPTAPTIFAQTEPVIDKGEDEESAEDDKIVGYNVRFLAAVHETTGDAIGFEVVAKFSDKEVEYSKAEGDTAMEGTTLYKNVMVKGVSEPVTKYDADAIGMFAAGINGVPTNLDIVFEIKAYITYGESEKVETGVVTAQYANGTIMNLVGADTPYEQQFNTTSSAQAAIDAGIKNLYSGKMNPTIDNKRLRIPDVGWSHSFVELVGTEYFAQNYANLDTYAIEMDLDIAKKFRLGLYVNGTVDDSDSTSISQKTRKGAAFIQFMYDDDSNTLGSTIGNMKGKAIYARVASVDGSNVNHDNVWYKLYTIPSSFTGASETAKFKLSIVVDSTPDTGCDIHFFIEGEYKGTRTLLDTNTLNFDVHENSYVSLYAENSPLTLDNLKVSSVALTKGDDNTTITGYTETTTATPYSQNFDNDPVASVGVTRPYANDNCPSGLPLTINDAGQLQVNKHAWHDNADYFAHLVSADEVDAAGVYKFEADLDITALGTFGFTINNNVDESLTDNYTEYQQEMLFVSFRNLEAGASSTGKAGLHFRIAHYDENGNQTGSQDFYIGESATALKAKFTMIVDSSYTYEEKDTTTGETITKTGCKIYLFLDNKLITTVVYDNTYDVKDNSSIGIWAENTAVTIDNIKFTGVEKKN